MVNSIVQSKAKSPTYQVVKTSIVFQWEMFTFLSSQGATSMHAQRRHVEGPQKSTYKRRSAPGICIWIPLFHICKYVYDE